MWKQVSNDKDKLVFRSDANETSTWSLIYKHSELGKFYIIDNIMTLPFLRKHIFDLAQQYERVGIEKKELIDKTDQILKLLKDKPQGYELDIYSITQRINMTCKDGWDFFKTQCMIMPLLITQDGWDIGNYDQSEAMARVNLWMKDKYLIEVFMNAASQCCSTVTNSFEDFTQMSLPIRSL